MRVAVCACACGRGWGVRAWVGREGRGLRGRAGVWVSGGRVGVWVYRPPPEARVWVWVLAVRVRVRVRAYVEETMAVLKVSRALLR